MRGRTFVLGIISVFLALLGSGSSLLAQQPGPEKAAEARAQAVLGTGFTYQGRLTDGDSPADGEYDFEFKLYDDADTGAQVGDTVTKGDVAVSDGLFTVELDFGSGVFIGEARYLEIGVRPGSSSGAYTTLSPRQPITAAPFALSLPGFYTLPNTFSPNVVGGATANLAWDGLVGATISGGGGEDMGNRVTDFFGTIGGGANNLAGNESEDVTDAWYATVGGGWQNTASDVNATVVGGAENTASGVSSFVGGGFQNEASGLLHATVCGGEANQASGEHNATVGGGDHNVASGYWNATVAGGANNVASGDESTVGGGAENTASGEYNATVSGGYRNTASGTDATVAGGNSNTAGDWAATVSGGYTNTVTAAAATVGGGEANYASGGHASIGGGYANAATGWSGTVGGGWRNTATAAAATVGGGRRNEANADYSVVAGGYWNVTYGITSTISGGQQNFINRDYATIGGGHNNQIYADYGTIGGGGGQDDASANIVYDDGGTIGGGTANRAGTDDSDPVDANHATVGGGDYNTASGMAATIGGGHGNTVTGGGATVGGGDYNTVTGGYGVVGGGLFNTVTEYAATVSGGFSNTISGPAATVGGGYENSAGDWMATVGGGARNTASGRSATVPGGEENTAAGDYSFAAGCRAQADNEGCFVWGDSTDNDVACEGDDEFVIRASGGVYLYTSGDLSSGSYLGPGMSDWNPLPPPSDRNLKENIAPIDPQAVLAQIVSVPVSTWNYKSGDPAVRHMGPMAQDFYAAFGLGKDERHISTIDADGVALAAIQGLHGRAQEQAARIEALEAQNAALQGELTDLEARVRALERGSGPAKATLLPGAGILVAGIGAAWAARRRGLLAPVEGGDR